MSAFDSIDEQLRDITELAAGGQLQRAQELIEPLASLYVNEARVQGVAGGVYWRAGLHGCAILCFRRATELSPSSELASLGLFHALCDAGQRLEAEEEVVRFLSGRTSHAYDELLAEHGLEFDGLAIRKRAGR